jgi:hypothetical protein
MHNRETSVLSENEFSADRDKNWTCHQIVNKQEILMMKAMQVTTVTCNSNLDNYQR